jgi:hypothetical protein
MVNVSMGYGFLFIWLKSWYNSSVSSSIDLGEGQLGYDLNQKMSLVPAWFLAHIP